MPSTTAVRPRNRNAASHPGQGKQACCCGRPPGDRLAPPLRAVLGNDYFPLLPPWEEEMWKTSIVT